MDITLTSGSFRAVVSRKGAELVSFYDSHLKKEYIWQGDPAYWEGQAPFLFPLVGRMPDGKVRIAGKEYPMPLHGFARNTYFSVKEQSDSRVVLTCSDTKETHTMFPFAFVLYCEFTLDDNRLTIRRTVQNHSDAPMPYCIGEHFGFQLDFNGRTINDYFLRMSQKETVPIYRVTENFDLSEPEPYFENEDVIRLDEHIFDHDALIFRDLAKNGAGIENNCDKHGAHVAAPDFGQLAFWSVPNAPFVCIEPWCGHISPPNTPIDLEKRCGALILEPHDQKSFTTVVSVF